MAVALSISVEGIAEVQAMLARIDPSKNAAYVARGLVACALRTQEIATREKIKRGGKGPPVPGILTSRTGTLRRSIAVNRSPLPWAVEVGTGLTYGAVHEMGGTFGKPSRMIQSHTRTVAFGKKRAPFTVPSHFRSGHYAEYPPRPFLGPALNKAAEEFDDIFAREIAKEIR